MDKFGLIGKNIAYSFSKNYFNKKFKKETIQASYENFDIDSIENFPAIITNTEGIKGLNVTIPYKEAIIPFLDKLDKKAKKIGAVNTIKITSKGNLKGYNTDYYGFKKSLKPLLKPHHKRALILGTGGASKAIAQALKKLNIDYVFVSRKPSKKGFFTYNALTKELVSDYQIIINCTPLGTFPNVQDCPKIPYDAITKTHILYDLIYNPEETKFLTLGRKKGATTINGLKMLQLQADKAWSIWNK
ncbi:shikimate dehydrogenase family protein [Mangrovimonas spongiae]|uniref:Shikimate dehydrogenase n=1 Tax=Mangrovimonas spongiae TaxID=2494697 RepID=A0A3R9M9U4_9FLAO|nr:shikimate dehydrogenase [Mangrovimonas spongiae]RSK40687.1 shikimate dehydrogenase [Mangrovimonas spongiae]